MFCSGFASSETFAPSNFDHSELTRFIGYIFCWFVYHFCVKLIDCRRKKCAKNYHKIWFGVCSVVEKSFSIAIGPGPEFPPNNFTFYSIHHIRAHRVQLFESVAVWAMRWQWEVQVPLDCVYDEWPSLNTNRNYNHMNFMKKKNSYIICMFANDGKFLAASSPFYDSLHLFCSWQIV